MPNQPHKMVVVVCESFNRYDSAGQAEAFLKNGFQIFEEFSLEPSGNSGTSFVCMDSEEDWDPTAAGMNPWTPAFKQRVPTIASGGKWISNFVPTKFFYQPGLGNGI